MKLYAWLTVCQALFITEKLCSEIPDGVPPPALNCNTNTGKIYYQICFPGGGGFHSYVCNVKDRKNYIYKWDKVKTDICPKGKQGCKCEPYGDDNHPICECHNLAKPPPFPSTGILRWSGTQKKDLHFYVGGQRPKYGRLEGEAHRMANGQFLYSSKYSFSIFIPNGVKGFIKYTGRPGNSDCTMREVDASRDLSSIWWYKYGYNLEKATPLKDGISMQKWQNYEEEEDGSSTYIWKVKYDSEKKYALPVEYRYQSYSWFDHELYQAIKYYEYEPINGNDESFQLKDFCSNL